MSSGQYRGSGAVTPQAGKGSAGVTVALMISPSIFRLCEVCNFFFDAVRVCLKISRHSFCSVIAAEIMEKIPRSNSQFDAPIQGRGLLQRKESRDRMTPL